MTVVSNTSPIMNLAAIGHLDVLRQLYGKVIIPEAVRQELGAMPSLGSGDQTPLDSSWIETRRVAKQQLLESLRLELDAGEAEAVALAIESRRALLLVDERRGRRVASRFGIRCLGLLGVPIEAKRRGLVPAVRPLLDAVMIRAGFWMTRRLYDRVLQEAGE